MNKIKIQLPSDPKFLKIIRSSIAHISEVCGFSEDDCNAVTIAVDEAAANIIKHTYNGNTDQEIIAEFEILEDKLEVVLRDFGKKIDPKMIKSRNLDDVRPGGLGVHLIKTTMDEVVYDNSQKVGNKLTMIKYLPEEKRGQTDVRS